MKDELICPNCRKRNEINKFCIYCGYKLFDDEQIKLITDNPQPYCLNCGRPVRKGQEKCECGYEFRDINCPECNAKNSYTNRFCTTCGNKLWTSDVYNYKYPKRLFETHIFKVKLPYALRYTSLYNRPKMDFERFHSFDSSISSDELEAFKSKMDEFLCEIGSRWKVVSPHYCINCISIINSNEYSCSKCGLILFADKKRISCLQTENNYVEPKFDIPELKWTLKVSNHYLDSLSPAIGESQFEYRERLKWEFAENTQYKINLIGAIKYKLEEEERKKRLEERRAWEREYIRLYGGGYCDLSCSHCYEEFFDEGGGMVGDFDSGGYYEYYCDLGHSANPGSFCKDYE